MNTTTNFRTKKMVQMALFTAIIAILTFSPLGYLKIGILSMTLIGIPVIVGAIVFGPVSGAILGGVFGITSFMQCFGADPFGVALLNINPVLTFIMCMIPRILMGYLTGLIFVGLKKTKGISYLVSSLLGSLINTALFMSALIWFFYQSDVVQGYAESLNVTNAFAFFLAAAGINAICEAVLCMIVGTAVAKALAVYNAKNTIK